MDIKSFVDVVDCNDEIKTPSLGQEEVDSTIVLDTVDVEKKVEEKEDQEATKQHKEIEESIQIKQLVILEEKLSSRPPYACRCTIRPNDEILNPIFRTVLMYGGGGGGGTVGNSQQQLMTTLLNRAITGMFDDVFVKQLNFWKQAQGLSSSLLYIGREEPNKDTTMTVRDGTSSRGSRIAVISCQDEESSSFQDWIVITQDEETAHNFLVLLRTHGMIATTGTK